MKKSGKTKHKKNFIKDIDQKMLEEENNSKKKSRTEFDSSLACSIKCLAVKKNQTVSPTTKFFSGKMLMFAKLSLKSFVYELLKTFFSFEKSKGNL